MNKGKQLDAQVSIATGFPSTLHYWFRPRNYVTSLTMYTTHTCVSGQKKKYIYIYTVRTRGKAMALQAIKIFVNIQ